MRAIDLALKDLYQIIKDWKAALFLLIMPIAFTLLFGLLFAEAGTEEASRLPVGFLDLDQPGIAGTHLISLLDLSDVVRPVVDGEVNEEALAEQVGDGDLAAAIIVPEGYSAALMSGETPQMRVIAEEQSNSGTTAIHAIETSVNRLVGAAKIARLTTDLLVETDPERFGGDLEKEATFEDSLELAVIAWKRAPFSVTTLMVVEEDDGEPAVDEVYGSTYAHSSTGMMAQFAIAGLIGAAEVVVAERKTRTLQRLLTTAITRGEVIAGHYLAMFVMVFLQLLLLTGVGHLVFGVGYFTAPVATLVMISAFAFFTAALGMLIGAVAKTGEQVIILSLLPMFVLSALGGAWVPLEFTGETFQTIGHFTPLAWAIDGLKNITVRGLGLESVLEPSAVLLGFGILCLAVAVWQFRVE